MDLNKSLSFFNQQIKDLRRGMNSGVEQFDEKGMDPTLNSITPSKVTMKDRVDILDCPSDACKFLEEGQEIPQNSKVGIPSFSGKNPRGWLFTIRRYFLYIEPLKVKKFFFLVPYGRSSIGMIYMDGS